MNLTTPFRDGSHNNPSFNTQFLVLSRACEVLTSDEPSWNVMGRLEIDGPS